MKKIEIYTKPNCAACNALKDLLSNQYKDTFETVTMLTIGVDVTVEELTDKIGYKPRAVPQVFIDDEYVGGYKQTLTKLQQIQIV